MCAQAFCFIRQLCEFRLHLLRSKPEGQRLFEIVAVAGVGD
jgi:hypothetical protein